MGFDRRLAEQIIRSRDRDKARFFAGRDDEIKAFKDALMEAVEFDSATFRIYQGPPGCGKTSLAQHLAGTHADEVLFVPCEPNDLSDSATLSDRIERAAIERGGRIAQAVRTTAQAAGERLGARPLADAAMRALAGFSSNGATVVLHMDEAHGRLDARDNPGVGRTLLNLHTVGIGAPCVMMLTGLGHTRRAVTSIKGLTRLADNATHEIGALSKRDCAWSTSMMLDSLDATGPKRIHDRLANLTAELSHEWPAHLKGAQSSLCEELVRVGGDLREVNASNARDRSDRRRHAYYQRRLEDHPAFYINRSLTRRILVDVAREKPKSQSALDPVCKSAIDGEGATHSLEARGVTPTVMADALLEKGIVRDTGRRIVPSIPSMVDWAAEELGTESRRGVRRRKSRKRKFAIAVPSFARLRRISGHI